MKNTALKLGLVGVILTTPGIMRNKIFAQETLNLIRGNKAYTTKDKKSISYENTNIFGSSYITGENPDLSEEELDFFICPQDQIQIQTRPFDNSNTLLVNQYIPIRVRDIKGIPINTLIDFPLESLIKTKRNITSKNKVASIEDLTKEMEFLYPPININNQDYLIIPISPTIDNRNYFDFSKTGRRFILIPFDEELKLTIDNENNQVDIYSKRGVFQPRLEESLYNQRNNMQREQNSDFDSREDPNRKTDYMKYREQIENERLRGIYSSSAVSAVKHVSNIPTQTQEKNTKTNKDTQITRYYTVQQGDGFWKIAREQLGDEKRWSEIQKLNNGIQSSELKPKQRILIPYK